MKKIELIGVLVVLAVALTGCGKYKKPTDVDFYVDMNKTPTLGGNLAFSTGHIVLDRFEFDGKRIKGDDVFFEREYSNGLLIPYSSTTSVSELDFTIPQGEYDRIDIGLRTFDDNNTICILVEGTYTYQNSTTIPFRFEFEDSEQFKIRAENDNGGSIILDKDIVSPVKILFDPEYWFSPVPISNFESATTTSVQGVNTLVVSKNENDNIYDIVINRIEESSLVVFNY